MKTREEQKRETHQRILQSAYQEFCNGGIQSFRAADVAKAAEVSHGAVFAHFRTQDELVVEVIETYTKEMAIQTHLSSANGTSVRAVMEAQMEAMRKYEMFYARLLRDTENLPPAARAAWVAVQSAISFHLCPALEHGMQAGTIKKAPVSLHFNAWMGLVSYYLLNARLFAPEGHVLERYGDTLIDHYLLLICVALNNADKEKEDHYDCL